MKKYSFLSLIVFSFFLFSCGPSHEITTSWVNPNFDRNKNYSKIFILVMNHNQSVKNIIETDLTREANAKGFVVVKSSEYFTPSFGKDHLPSKDAIIARVQQMGCDGILTVSLVDKQSESRYVPGINTFMGPGMGRMGMGAGMGFGGFYGAMGPMMYNPGYYTEDKTYFYEASIFDVATETMIWSSQSETYNPSSMAKFSREYSKLLAERIRTDLMAKK